MEKAKNETQENQRTFKESEERLNDLMRQKMQGLEKERQELERELLGKIKELHKEIQAINIKHEEKIAQLQILHKKQLETLEQSLKN